MVKRIASASFWFVAIAWACNYLGYYLGMPFLAGPVIAAAVSTFVGLDPLHVIWKTVGKNLQPEPMSQAVTSPAVVNLG